jgi:hypothetical protein
MKLSNEEFREQHKPLHIPSSFKEAASVTDQVVFALAELGEAAAGEVIRRIELLDPAADAQQLIAAAHEVLTQLYQKGLLGAVEKGGDLVYNLHKITEANSGRVDPELLAPGLD